MQENTTHLAYEIDDLTGGRITVKRWIDKEVSECEVWYYGHGINSILSITGFYN